ncbi:hypothetical protein [Roseivirga pacifica]|uniref:hypothetical protein n=1 Tax=Roseivirga pacifica TaxID=1267423 RepID=UPI003BAA7517
MKRINLDFMLYLLGLLLCLSACSKDDEGTPDTNNKMTIKGREYTIAKVAVTKGAGFTGVEDSWRVVLADAIYAPDIDDDDYEGDGYGIVIEYQNDNHPIEIDTYSQSTGTYMLRIAAYDGGSYYQSDSFDVNTRYLTVTINGDRVTIEGEGYDADDSDDSFTFFYEGSVSIFN